MKSSIFIESLSSLIASIPASVVTAFMSAPELPFVIWASSCMRMSSARFMLRVCILNICFLASSSGSGTSISLSNLPGRSIAGSSMSGLFVAAIIFVSPLLSNPSISDSSCISVL